MKTVLAVLMVLLVSVPALAAQPQLEAFSASAESGVLTISGVSFDNGSTLEVTLGGVGSLAVTSSSDTLITAALPPVDPGTNTYLWNGAKS